MLTIGNFNSFWGFLGHPVQYRDFVLIKLVLCQNCDCM